MCAICCYADLGNFMLIQFIKRRENMYEFWWNSKKVHLVPLMNKKKNFKYKRKIFLAIVKSYLKDDCNGCKKL